MQPYNNPNQPPPPYLNQPSQPPYQGGPGYPNQGPPQPYQNYGPPPTPPKRRGRGWLWVLGIIVVLAAIAVIGSVTGVMTFSGSFSTGGSFGVKEVTLAKGFDGDNAVNPTSTFSPSDNPLYSVVKLQNAPANTVVKGVWTAVDAGGEQNVEIGTKELTLAKTGDQVANFSVNLPRAWPTGKYKFELYLNNKLEKTLEFQIQ